MICSGNVKKVSGAKGNKEKGIESGYEARFKGRIRSNMVF